MNIQILIISTNKHKLHELEFVKPIEQILTKNSLNYVLIHISKLNSIEISNFSHIIICGTALKDFEYFKYSIESTLKIIEKLSIPTFGICSGAQILANFLKFPLFKHNVNQIINLKSLEDSSNLNIEKDQILQVYSLHSFLLNSRSLKEDKKNSRIILVHESSPELIELLQIKNFILCFFHIEIKNKEILLKWINSYINLTN